MAHAMRRESNADKNDQDNDDVDNSEGATSAKKLHKSILRTTSKTNTVWENVKFLYFL